MAPAAFSGAIEQLHEQAVTATGLSDFGSDDYRQGLQVLLDSYDETARFGDVGRHGSWTMLRNCLRGRLHAVDGIRRNPGCRERRIEKPLFIVGLPRTGTTILHRLLASHPANQGLEYWLGSFPQPRPPRADWAENAHFREVENSLAMLDQINPELKAIHEMSAGGVDECRLLLMQSFANVTFQANATVPGYARWLYTADMRPAYQLYADSLRLIGMHAAGKRWVLKDPSHLWSLDVLLDTFPDATVIQTHRDPVALIPSVSSLVFSARRMQEPEISPRDVGLQELEQWQRVLTQSLAVRKKHAGCFIDVHFDNLVRDPVQAVAGIYTQLGESLERETTAQMQGWMRDHPQHKHGEHSYSAADFELEEAVIREQFADYCAFFGIRH